MYLRGANMITVDTLAKVILSFRDDISNKKLQKLAYYVYAWYLTLFGSRITDMTFEAWEHGPVSRKLYNNYKTYGWSVIPRYRGFVLAENEKIKFIQSVVGYYGNFDADELEHMTHNEAPWNDARLGCGSHEASDAVISEASMIDCYSKQTDIRDIIMGEFYKVS